MRNGVLRMLLSFVTVKAVMIIVTANINLSRLIANMIMEIVTNAFVFQ